MDHLEYQEREADQQRRELRDEQADRHYEHAVRRGYWLCGSWFAIDERYQEVFDAAGVPESMTWTSEHEYLEDAEACLKGLSQVKHTPQAVAAHPSILFLDWLWVWDAAEGVFVGRKRRFWDDCKKGESGANHQG